MEHGSSTLVTKYWTGHGSAAAVTKHRARHRSAASVIEFVAGYRSASVTKKQWTWHRSAVLLTKRWSQIIERDIDLPHQSHHHHHHHQSLNCEDRWSTTDYSITSFLHFLCSPLPSGTWRTPGLSIPWCCLFPPIPLSAWSFSFFYCALQNCFGQTWWTGDRAMPLQFASLLRMVRRSKWGLIACCIFAQTSSLVTWSLYEMRSILR